MFQDVVVGVDGDEGGRDAIVLAAALSRDGGQLTLAHISRDEPLSWRGWSVDKDNAERARARDLLRKAADEAGIEARFRVHYAAGVGRGLHEVAEARGADLLVIGSTRRGLLGRVLTTDDTRAALNGAPCAVAIAPAGYHHQPAAMREIGVGYDGSPESKHALGVARTLATERHSRLSAFEAVSFPSYLFTAPVPADDTTFQELVDAARERVASIDGVEPHAAYGDAAEELALYSASLDLLVIGSRSYGPMGRLVHGSTAQELARMARCPLLVLTRAARTADAYRMSLDEHDTTAVSAR
jgi:nucleotide-binding universal stress UspA family protein